MKQSDEFDLSDEDIKEAAEEAAKDIAVVASNAGISVQELFEGLDKKLIIIEKRRKEREKNTRCN